MDAGFVLVVLIVYGVLLAMWSQAHRKRLVSLEATVLRLRVSERLLRLIAETLDVSASFGPEEGVAWLVGEIEGETWRDLERWMDKADVLDARALR